MDWTPSTKQSSHTGRLRENPQASEDSNLVCFACLDRVLFMTAFEEAVCFILGLGLAHAGPVP